MLTKIPTNPDFNDLEVQRPLKELRGGQLGQQNLQRVVVVQGEQLRDSNNVAVEMGRHNTTMMEHVSKVTLLLFLHESLPSLHLHLGDSSKHPNFSDTYC